MIVVLIYFAGWVSFFFLLKKDFGVFTGMVASMCWPIAMLVYIIALITFPFINQDE